MKPYPYKIPRSLLPYREQFEFDPEKAITRLERHVNNRGNDAVGNWLLSTFYIQTNQIKKAVKAAWKAKIFAAGSPSMRQLHYFLQHPEKFEAWNPADAEKNRNKSREPSTFSAPIKNLDSLITRLSSIEPVKLSVTDDQNGIDLSEQSTDVEDIVTETIAEIHARQGNVKAAINSYKKLITINPEREEIYRKEIEQLEKKSGS